MSVADYNTDPNSNTSISGINIAEGCPPSGINNAIRQMMADIRAADDDNVKLSGNQIISGNKTFQDNLFVGNTGNSYECVVIHSVSNGVRIAAEAWGASYHGGMLTLNGKTAPTDAGLFKIEAQDTSNNKALLGKPDGTLTWDSKDIITNGGNQSIGGVKAFSDGIRSTATTIAMINPNITKGTAPDAQRNTDIIFTENVADPLGSISGGRVMARLRNVYTTAGDNGITLQIFKPTSGSTTTKQVSFRAMAAGTYNLVPESKDISLGLNASANKWKEIWCAQSSINTSSDERIKQQIADIPDAVLDAWGDVDWIQFKYNDAVEEKGADKARLHNGLIAQRVDGAFKAHGLDASKYGLFLYDAWDAEPEERGGDGTLIREAQPAGDAYGLRYTEALCMEAAYQRRRADRAETRITELERRLDEMEAVLASIGGQAE